MSCLLGTSIILIISIDLSLLLHWLPSTFSFIFVVVVVAVYTNGQVGATPRRVDFLLHVDRLRSMYVPLVRSASAFIQR